MSEESNKNSVTDLNEVYEKIFEWAVATFPTPGHLIAFYDKQLREEEYDLHQWQAKLHTDILSKNYTSEEPLELALLAVNGSGKDKFVIAPFVVWFLFTNKMAVCPITSSSGVQMTNQTEKYIRILCQSINSYHGYELFEVKQRSVKCNVTGSEAVMFATDEAGKAEGYHPIIPNAKMAIIVNEAKSVKEEIFDALGRCTGFSHWIEVSSPGRAEGHFYRFCTSNRTRKDEVTGETSNAVKFVRVTSDDCPHLGKGYKDLVKEMYGEGHHLYKSRVLAEFGSDDEEVVLSVEKYDRCIKFPPQWIKGKKRRAGLDLSGGGDEQALTVIDGNKIIAIEAMKITDAVLLVNKLILLFEKYELQGCVINADAGGLGKPIIDMLHDRGWTNVRYIFNQSTPKDELSYKTLGTEMWFGLALLIENQEVVIGVNDDVFRKQICNRYYKYTANNVVILESKAQARAKGHPSPDRADSVALAFLDYVTPTQSKRREEKLKKIEEDVNTFGKVPTIRKFAELAVKRKTSEDYRKNSGIINATFKVTSEGKNEIKKELNQILLQVKEYHFNNN